MKSIKEAAWWALGVLFVLTCIPPVLIVAAIAIVGGHLERE